MFIDGSYHCLTFSTDNTGLECDDTFAKISGPHACQVKPNSKPWIISLYKVLERGGRNMTFFMCGGTLLGSKLVLTAAHCICQCKIREGRNCVQQEVSPNCNSWKKVYVIAGDHDTQKYDEGEQKNIIKEAKVHDRWDGTKVI